MVVSDGLSSIVSRSSVHFNNIWFPFIIQNLLVEWNLEYWKCCCLPPWTIFSHGQLYIALSRVTFRTTTKILTLLNKKNEGRSNSIANFTMMFSVCSPIYMNQVQSGGRKNSVRLTRTSHIKLLPKYGSEVFVENFQKNNLNTCFSVHNIFVKK